nr:hypothetical protein [Mycobacteroides chelonae]
MDSTILSSPPLPEALALFMQSRCAAGRSCRTNLYVPQLGRAVRSVKAAGGGEAAGQ